MSKPIVFFDTETTGLSRQNDWIIQLSALKVIRETWEVIDQFNHYIKPPVDFDISQAAAETHGLTKDFILAHGESLRDVVGPAFIQFIADCDLCGFNSNAFDIEFCYKDFANAGLEFPFEGIRHYDVLHMQHRLVSNRLGDLYKRYTGQTMEDAGLMAHDALSDVSATVAVMRCQFKEHDLTWEDVDEWQENNPLVPDGTIRRANKEDEPELIVFNQGKYRDKDIYSVMCQDPSYLRWCKNNLFSRYTLKVARDYCLRCQAKKDGQAK